ncbi:ThiF family adenylyltransferase [Pseudomonas nitroreducens]|uniref:ThiF family adenylyltransferase n=1 Tax=Pseudomonas nitroreducens TaxID=46680 RepID=A0A5R9A790_PSENT|nr:ThiF family adenylyltransferase [Pseudomonas nitroreducens]TLP74561.1 ThiF family adenylyltransferase [Pseudomonas nitroreducens]
MSKKPTVPNPSVARLIDEGFEIEIRHQHLLVHSIPYLNSNGEVVNAILACPYSEMGDTDTVPNDHTMWLQGDKPHLANGNPMDQAIAGSTPQTLFDNFTVHHHLSNKNGDPEFPKNFYDKVTHYHTLLTSQARAVDPNADGRTGVVHQQRDENSVFKYPDTASARVGITALTQRLEVTRIAIVGLGGTGSYILDLLAKTPVRELHLFDGDEFETHNAFRAPGAASFEQLVAQPKKVEYFAEAFAPMRHGLHPHAYHLTADNVQELGGFDFVFVAVDHGPSRRVVVDYLRQEGIPFIDVGVGVEKEELDNGDKRLAGTCRITLATREKQDHLNQRLNFGEEDGNDLYKSNIQVADLNALNAALAVIRWKQYMGFYLDLEQSHTLNMALSLQSLNRDDQVPFAL